AFPNSQMKVARNTWILSCRGVSGFDREIVLHFHHIGLLIGVRYGLRIAGLSSLCLPLSLGSRQGDLGRGKEPWVAARRDAWLWE
ncbi:MAG: hypothetical protein ACPGLY_18950, partial [Rubripirellula sp.]